MLANIATPAPLVSIRHLTIALPHDADRRRAVDDISFDIMRGEIVCVVGESGSGKSICAQALMGLLPPSLPILGGSILFEGRDLLTVDQASWRALRGARIGMIFQEPMTALNPLMRIGDQIIEVFEAHHRLKPRQRRARALALASEVGLTDPERILRAYPHEVSGGQRQRAMIAMALALEPAVLIADEPTTALDVTTQAQILALLREIQRRHGMCVMFITHDFGVVAEIADRVVVLQAGKVVENATAEAILKQPQHGYTKTLLSAVPTLKPPIRDGMAPMEKIADVKGLIKSYSIRRHVLGIARSVDVVRDVTFDLYRGQTLGLVGESGSGKSSIAKLLVRLIDPDHGAIRVGGVDLSRLRGRALRSERRRVQMIFQDPFASLNPRRKIGAVIADAPLARGTSKREALDRVAELLQLVGLKPEAMNRFPHEFSGGQRQRIGIARALSLDPEILVADEPVSALDVSVQAQVLALLEDLKTRLGLSILFITHDMRVAAQICDNIAVLHRGEIVEMKTTRDLFSAPEHPYTKGLLAAVPGRSASFWQATV